MIDTSIRVKRLVVGILQANCYLLWKDDRTRNDAVVIDPGSSPDLILKTIFKNSLNITHIINTHSHWDHTRVNAQIQSATGADIYVHSKDAPRNFRKLYEQTKKSFIGGQKGRHLLVEEGDIIEASDALKLKVIHTPGHTRGGMCLLLEGHGMLFTGDTLFAGAFGRYDLSGGSFKSLMHSIKEKLFTLPDDTTIYPGHGPTSTIGRERIGQKL